MCWHVCVEPRGQHLALFVGSGLPCFVRQGLSLAWRLLIQLGWLVNKPTHLPTSTSPAEVTNGAHHHCQASRSISDSNSPAISPSLHPPATPSCCQESSFFILLILLGLSIHLTLVFTISATKKYAEPTRAVHKQRRST